MSAKQNFQFGGFTLVPAEQKNAELAAKWTKADPSHAEMDPAFWTEQLPGRDSYLLEERGAPVFFFKLVKLEAINGVELHIQFGPNRSPTDRIRTMRGITEGMGWLEKTLALGGFETISFDSANPFLTKFCTKRLGFTARAGRLWKTIERQRTLSVRCDDSSKQSATGTG